MAYVYQLISFFAMLQDNNETNSFHGFQSSTNWLEIIISPFIYKGLQGPWWQVTWILIQDSSTGNMHK